MLLATALSITAALPPATETIVANQFRNCPKLSQVELPDSLTSIA